MTGAGAEYYLTGSSPCVDAGVKSAPNMPTTGSGWTAEAAGRRRGWDGGGQHGGYEQFIAETPVLSWLQLLLMRD